MRLRARYEDADPGVVRASCEDERAGLGVDPDHDRASREAGHRIECPVLALWGDASGSVDVDPLEIWDRWATDVSGRGLDRGHFLMEVAPGASLAELESFLAEAARARSNQGSGEIEPGLGQDGTEAPGVSKRGPGKK